MARKGFIGTCLTNGPCEQSRWEMGQRCHQKQGHGRENALSRNSKQLVLNGCLMKQPFFNVKIWNHPTERTNKKLLFRVPGLSYNQPGVFNYLGPTKVTGFWPCEVFSRDVTIGFRIKTLKASFYRSFLNL